MSEENLLLQQAAALGGDPDYTKEHYRNWAETYNDDALLVLGYAGATIAADAIMTRVTETAYILDAGCGTGLAGLELLQRNYGFTIDGVDISPEMLERARKSGAYRKLSEADLMTPLYEFEDDCYDAIISTWVFTAGHVWINALDELIRIAKPGASIVLTVDDDVWEAEEYEDNLTKLSEAKKVKLTEVTQHQLHRNEDKTCRLVVLEVC